MNMTDELDELRKHMQKIKATLELQQTEHKRLSTEREEAIRLKARLQIAFNAVLEKMEQNDKEVGRIQHSFDESKTMQNALSKELNLKAKRKEALEAEIEKAVREQEKQRHVREPAEATGCSERKFADDLNMFKKFARTTANEDIMSDLELCQASVHE